MNTPNYAQIESIVQQLVDKIKNDVDSVRILVPTQYNSVDTDSDTGLLKPVAEGSEEYNHLAIAGINVLIEKINELAAKVDALEKAASNETTPAQ